MGTSAPKTLVGGPALSDHSWTQLSQVLFWESDSEMEIEVQEMYRGVLLEPSPVGDVKEVRLERGRIWAVRQSPKKRPEKILQETLMVI